MKKTVFIEAVTMVFLLFLNSAIAVQAPDDIQANSQQDQESGTMTLNETLDKLQGELAEQGVDVENLRRFLKTIVQMMIISINVIDAIDILYKSIQIETEYLYTKEESKREKFAETGLELDRAVNKICNGLAFIDEPSDECSQLRALYDEYKRQDKELWTTMDAGDGTLASKIIFEVMPPLIEKFIDKLKAILGKYNSINVDFSKIAAEMTMIESFHDILTRIQISETARKNYETFDRMIQRETDYLYDRNEANGMVYDILKINFLQNLIQLNALSLLRAGDAPRAAECASFKILYNEYLEHEKTLWAAADADNGISTETGSAVNAGLSGAEDACDSTGLKSLFNAYMEKDKELWAAIYAGQGTEAAKLVFEVLPPFGQSINDKLKELEKANRVEISLINEKLMELTNSISNPK